MEADVETESYAEMKADTEVEADAEVEEWRRGEEKSNKTR